MGKLAYGACLGRNDANFNAIKVGQTLIDDNYKTWVVDNYGCLKAVHGGDKKSPKEWDGDDYTIMSESDFVPAKEKPEEPAPQKPEPDVTETAEYWKQKYEEITVSDFTAKAMVNELRSRGYEVKCTRTIIEEL